MLTLRASWRQEQHWRIRLLPICSTASQWLTMRLASHRKSLCYGRFRASCFRLFTCSGGRLVMRVGHRGRNRGLRDGSRWPFPRTYFRPMFPVLGSENVQGGVFRIPTKPTTDSDKPEKRRSIAGLRWGLKLGVGVGVRRVAEPPQRSAFESDAVALLRRWSRMVVARRWDRRRHRASARRGPGWRAACRGGHNDRRGDRVVPGLRAKRAPSRRG